LIMPESYTIRRRAGIPAYGNRNPSRLFMTVALVSGIAAGLSSVKPLFCWVAASLNG
jgi:hypothetical protein